MRGTAETTETDGEEHGTEALVGRRVKDVGGISSGDVVRVEEEDLLEGRLGDRQSFEVVRLSLRSIPVRAFGLDHFCAESLELLQLGVVRVELFRREVVDLSGKVAVVDVTKDSEGVDYALDGVGIT